MTANIRGWESNVLGSLSGLKKGRCCAESSRARNSIYGSSSSMQLGVKQVLFMCDGKSNNWGYFSRGAQSG